MKLARKVAAEPPQTFEAWCEKYRLQCTVTLCSDGRYEAQLIAPYDTDLERLPAWNGDSAHDAELVLMAHVRGERFVVNFGTPQQREFSAPERWIHRVELSEFSCDKMRDQLRVILQSCPEDCRVDSSVAGTMQVYVSELERVIDRLKQRCDLGLEGYRLAELDLDP